jgi:hypothetical protein
MYDMLNLKSAADAVRDHGKRDKKTAVNSARQSFFTWRKPPERDSDTLTDEGVFYHAKITENLHDTSEKDAQLSFAGIMALAMFMQQYGKC